MRQLRSALEAVRWQTLTGTRLIDALMVSFAFGMTVGLVVGVLVPK